MERRGRTKFGFCSENAGRATKGEIVSEKDITYEGHPGREYQIKKDFITGISRAYMVNGHGYLLIALPTLAENETTGIYKFFDSFTLTKMESDAPPPPPMPKPKR